MIDEFSNFCKIGMYYHKTKQKSKQDLSVRDEPDFILTEWYRKFYNKLPQYTKFL